MDKNTIILNGNNIDLEDFINIVKNNYTIEISQASWKGIKKSRKYILNNLNNSQPVYGLNRGVGENKDKHILPDFYCEFNKNLIYSHCVAIDPIASKEEVRSAMLARLNMLLNGRTGIQPKIVKLLKNFLNYGIHPLMPKRGSIGQGDITCLSHIGLSLMGEGEVFYQGKRLNSSEAFKKTDLSAVKLGPKDGLAIVGSNAMALGFSVLALNKINNIIKIADLVYALSLEGLKGNTAPLTEKVNAQRPYKGQQISTGRVRNFLKDSYLWKCTANSLQDPVSYRCASHVHGAVLDSLKFARKQLKIQLNSSEDNPCVLTEEKEIIHSGNFEPLPWVLPLEMLIIGLSHVSRNSCSRSIKLSTPRFTKLSRFLTPAEGQTIAYGTIQKSFSSLDTEIRNLSNPCSVDYQSVAGNIEDHSTNAPYIIEKINKVIDNLYYILAMEAMHAAQAIDLRNVSNDIGLKTSKLYNHLRKSIPFLEKDRVLTTDIKKAYKLIKSKKILEIIH